MAKQTRKTNPKPARNPQKKAGPFKPQVHVRMYCQGLGDCFLLRFEREQGDFFHILIDCGIYKASPDAKAIMNQIVDDIIETTGNHIDVLVYTHEHWDHISGFSQALDKYQKMKIDTVWQAWTEDPNDAVAKKLRDKFEGIKAKMVGALRATHDEHTARAAAASKELQTPLALDNAFNVMGFFGVAKDEDEKKATDAYKDIKNLIASKNPRYLKPQMVLQGKDLGNTGVKAFVLGPPHDGEVLRQQNISKKDAYEKQKQALFDGMNSMLGLVEAQLDNEGDGPENRPFDRQLAIPIEDARRDQFFQFYYAFPDNEEHREAFRSIDDLAHDTLNQLALRMDNYTNNTSLVIAFQLPNGKVLLFPGDAQGGNWKSFADLTKPLRFEAEDTDAHKLLAATVLYKCGHHGSHNATPRTFGLDLMTDPELRAFVPVDHEIAAGAGYGEMPLIAIMQALDHQTKSRTYRADDEGAKPPADVFRVCKKQLTVKTKKDGKSFQRPMCVETSFDLD